MGRAVARLREVLHRRSLRITPVREAILEAVLHQQGHFEIPDLVRELQGVGVQEASQATVYRALPLLVEAGIIQQTLVSGSKLQYESTFEREHHDHLVCGECGKVIEFHFEAFEMLQKELAAKYDFELTRHFHELIGRCGECRRKLQRPSS
jgi:Fur family transcriptional regulator, ferric uptake regulator